MKKNIIAASVVVILLAGAGIWYSDSQVNKSITLLPSMDPSLSSSSESTPSGSFIAKAAYVCGGGKTIDASFYRGETKTVKPGEPPVPNGSVKIVLSDGRSFDLPQTISADGGRYANSDESFVFWSKGDGAMVLENGLEKDYVECLSSAKDAKDQGIKVISPNGGEVWSKGQTVQILWSAAEDIKAVNIRLAISDGGEGQNFNASIASDVPNTGNYQWTVQDLYAEVLGVKTLPVSTKYLITVEDKDHNNVYDSSDATFSISGPQPANPSPAESLESR